MWFKPCLVFRRVWSCPRTKRRRRRLKQTRRNLVGCARCFWSQWHLYCLNYRTLHAKFMIFFPSLHLVVAGDEGHLGQEDREGGRLQSSRRVPLLYCHLTGNSHRWWTGCNICDAQCSHFTLSMGGQQAWSESWRHRRWGTPPPWLPRNIWRSTQATALVWCFCPFLSNQHILNSFAQLRTWDNEWRQTRVANPSRIWSCCSSRPRSSRLALLLRFRTRIDLYWNPGSLWIYGLFKLVICSGACSACPEDPPHDQAGARHRWSWRGGEWIKWNYLGKPLLRSTEIVLIDFDS